jgi:hypothetical protein
MSVLLQSTCSPITIGCVLEDGYGGVMPDGYYSNGVSWYVVTGGAGVVTSQGSCTPPTTSTTTAAPPPPGTVYIFSDVSCGGSTTVYVTGDIYPVVGKFYKPTSAAAPLIFDGSACFECTGSLLDTAVYSDLVFGTEYTDCTCDTTTTTTAAPGDLIPYTLYYSSVSGEDACTTSNSITVYSSCSPLVAECLLWYDIAGTVVADEYFYADQANDILYSMYVTHFLGTGEIFSVSSCATTTTSTTTTTTSYPYGDFELDPQYGINITSLTASSGTLPAFTFPRNSGSSQTLDMVSGYTISTVFTVGISGTRLFGTNKTITLYVNSISRACQVITSDGPQTKSLTSSVAILDTDNVTIAIDNATSC